MVIRWDQMAKMMMLITWTALHPVQWPGRIRSGWNFLNPETVRPVSDGGGDCGDGHHDEESFLAGICAFFCVERKIAQVEEKITSYYSEKKSIKKIKANITSSQQIIVF